MRHISSNECLCEILSWYCFNMYSSWMRWVRSQCLCDTRPYHWSRTYSQLYIFSHIASKSLLRRLSWRSDARSLGSSVSFFSTNTQSLYCSRSSCQRQVLYSQEIGPEMLIPVLILWLIHNLLCYIVSQRTNSRRQDKVNRRHSRYEAILYTVFILLLQINFAGLFYCFASKFSML